MPQVLSGGADRRTVSRFMNALRVKTKHLTLVCSRCGRSREIRDAELFRLLKLRRYPSFVMAGFDLYIHGLCSRCRGGGRIRK